MSSDPTDTALNATGPAATAESADTASAPRTRREARLQAESRLRARPTRRSRASRPRTEAPRTEAPRRTQPPPHRGRRLAAVVVSTTAVAAVGLLTVSLTLPAGSVAAPDAPLTGAAAAAQLRARASGGGEADIQAYVAPAAAGGATGEKLDRSAGYSTATVAQLAADLAGATGIRHVSGSVFANNPLCPVQWPFAVGVPISFGFGPRPGEFHQGVDFTPGAGSHVQAIAAGTVRVASENYFGYGVAVMIDHVIDGQKVSSLYGHMEFGSLQVHEGQTVKAGQYLGRTGNTGHSFGAHTHVEIRPGGGAPIDPLPWLREHNRC